MERNKDGWTPWASKETLEPLISQKNEAKGEIERGKERRSTRVRRHGPPGSNPAEEGGVEVGGGDAGAAGVSGGGGGGWGEWRRRLAAVARVAAAEP
jgi:hypothetical protein